MLLALIMKTPSGTFLPLVLAVCGLVAFSTGCTTTSTSQQASITMPDLPDLSSTEGDYYTVTYKKGPAVGTYFTRDLEYQGDWVFMETYPSKVIQLTPVNFINKPKLTALPNPVWLKGSAIISIQKLTQQPEAEVQASSVPARSVGRAIPVRVAQPLPRSAPSAEHIDPATQWLRLKAQEEAVKGSNSRGLPLPPGLPEDN